MVTINIYDVNGVVDKKLRQINEESASQLNGESYQDCNQQPIIHSQSNIDSFNDEHINSSLS